MSVNRNVQYFQACLSADSARADITSVFSSRIEAIHVFEKPSGRRLTRHLAVPHAYGRLASNLRATYRREKSLYLGSHFLVAKAYRNFMGKRKEFTICAPVFLYPAEIEYNDVDYRISIEPNTPQLNESILRYITVSDENDGSIDFSELNQSNFSQVITAKTGRTLNLSLIHI